MRRECSNCELLSNCREVTEQLLATHHMCRKFNPAPQPVLDARADIKEDLGLLALRYEIPHRKTDGARPKARRRRKHV
jgi:hypothetical protein